MKTLVSLFSLLPVWYIHLLASLMAFVLQYLVRYRLRVVKQQIRDCFPEKSEQEMARITRAFYRNLADITLESLKGYRLSPKGISARLVVTNPELLEQARGKYKSVLLMAAHHGNWEWMLQGMSRQLSFPIDCVYKPLSNKSMDQVMRHIRSRFGGEPIPKNDFLMTVMKRRAAFRGYAMNADQLPLISNEKHWTTFLGRDTAFQIGAETIARLTKYPAYFLEIVRKRRGYYAVTVHQMTEAPYPKEEWKLTEAYAAAVEKMVRENPQDWLWSHKRWKYPKPLYS